MSGTMADSLVPVGQPATQVSHTASAAHDRMDVALTAAEGSVRAAGTHLGPPVSAADAVGASMVRSAPLRSESFAAASTATAAG